jgi:TPR repeat protein
MNPLIALIPIMAATVIAADTTSSDPAATAKVAEGDEKTLIQSGDKAYLDSDFTSAEAHYIKAGELGSEEAIGKLFLLYTNDENPNRVSEFEARHKLAELGHVEHMVALAQDYAVGRGVEQSNEEAAKWYRKAAESRNSWAAYHLATMHGDGIGVPKDMTEAYVWARLSEEWKALPSNARWDSGAKTPLSEQVADELSPSEQRQGEDEVKKRMKEYEERAASQ